LARNGFDIIATFPALSDPLGLLLLSAVALVVTPAIHSTRLLPIPMCFLAPLAREDLADGALVARPQRPHTVADRASARRRRLHAAAIGTA
jgi:hypothetical protein